MSDALKRLLAERAKRIESEEKKDGTEQPTQLVPTEEVKASQASAVESPQATQTNEHPAQAETNELPVQSGKQEESLSGADGPAITATSSTHPLKAEMAALEQALNDEVPDFANKLREIHIKLRKDPHTVTLLSDEEIGLIVSGMEKHVNVQIVAPAAKKASSRKNLLANVSASDL